MSEVLVQVLISENLGSGVLDEYGYSTLYCVSCPVANKYLHSDISAHKQQRGERVMSFLNHSSQT